MGNCRSDEESKRSISDGRVTIEIGDFVDSYYLEKLKSKMGLTKTRDILELIILKWTGAAAVLSDEAWIGWDITLRLVNVEIWRSHPSWYITSREDKIGDRMNSVCVATKRDNYDQVTLHTGSTSNPGRVGLAWIKGLCRPRYRCSAVLSANTNYHTELHEFGHSLGLNHENKMAACSTDTDPVKGFMSKGRDHFRGCYRVAIDKTFTSSKKGCLYSESNPNTVWTSP